MLMFLVVVLVQPDRKVVCLCIDLLFPSSRLFLPDSLTVVGDEEDVHRAGLFPIGQGIQLLVYGRKGVFVVILKMRLSSVCPSSIELTA